MLLCQSAVFRCPVKSEFWLDYLKDWNLPAMWQGENQELLLDILRDRYLVEETIADNICLIRQHNLVRSIALVGLKQLDEEYEQCS